MNEIPKVSFAKPKISEIEFEIFTLSSLYSRRDRLEPAPDVAHRLDFYNVLFITNGMGRHQVDFQSYEFSQGSLLFISKGQVHTFDMDSEHDGYLMLFTESFLSKNLVHSDVLSFYRLYNYHLHAPIVTPNQFEAGVFQTIVNEIYKEYNDGDNFAKEEILQLLLKLLLLKAERIKRTVTTEEKSAERFIQFGIFQNLLEEHIAQTRNAKDYAALMSVSYKHLNEICKSVTGSTAKEVIDNLLVLEIKRRLAISDTPITELTYELGFDEPTNFVKYFKKHTLHSPSQFRKNLLQ